MPLSQPPEGKQKTRTKAERVKEQDHKHTSWEGHVKKNELQSNKKIKQTQGEEESDGRTEWSPTVTVGSLEFEGWDCETKDCPGRFFARVILISYNPFADLGTHLLTSPKVRRAATTWTRSNFVQ